MLVFLSLLQWPLAWWLSYRVSRAGGKQAALSASIMSGVILATPAWFAALTFLVSSTFLYLAMLVALLMFYYALGLISCGRWAKVALLEPKESKMKKTESVASDKAERQR
jgi:hypothetical protein